VLFWRELPDTYPHAKLVLVQRDEDKWVASIQRLLEGVSSPFVQYVLRYANPPWSGRTVGCGASWMELVFDSAALSVVMANAREAYRRHYLL
jgi:hypothetical protein